MEFYQERVRRRPSTLNTFGEFGAADTRGGRQDMHAQLETPRLHADGADTPPGMDTSPGNNITISLSGEDGDELRGYWDKLSDGGNVMMPLEKQMWGDEFGMLSDRFGIGWMVNIGQPR